MRRVLFDLVHIFIGQVVRGNLIVSGYKTTEEAVTAQCN